MNVCRLRISHQLSTNVLLVTSVPPDALGMPPPTAAAVSDFPSEIAPAFLQRRDVDVIVQAGGACREQLEENPSPVKPALHWSVPWYARELKDDRHQQNQPCACRCRGLRQLNHHQQRLPCTCRYRQGKCLREDVESEGGLESGGGT